MDKVDGEILKSIAISNKFNDMMDLVITKIQKPNQTNKQISNIYHLKNLTWKTKFFFRMLVSTTVFLELNETHRKGINYLINEKGKNKIFFKNIKNNLLICFLFFS